MAIYTIKANENIIYDPRSKDLQVFDPKLTLEVNKTGELKFKIYNTHPHYAKLVKCKTILTVLEDNRVIFKGRITEDTKDFNNGKQVDCEGVLAFLNDSIYKPFSFKGSPTDLFVSLVENHNSQVKEFQQFKIGRITVKDKNDYINRESNSYLKTWEVFKTRLLDTLGGYVQIRYREDGTYIDWLDDFAIENEDGTTSKIVSTQKIEFGVNLLDVKQTVEAPLATAIIPLGAKIKNDDGTEVQLTIENLEDEELDDLVKRGDTIYSKSGVAQYGWIYDDIKNTTWNDVTVDTNLYRKAKEYLSGTAVKLSETITLTAVDLQNVHAQISNFRFCEYVQVSSKPHGITGLYLLSKITMDLKNPQNTKITLGETKLTLIDQNLNINRELSENAEKIGQVMKDYVLNDELVEVRNEVLTTATAIIQDSQNIIFGAMEEYVSKGNFDEYKELVSTQFAQTARDFTFLFDNAITKINTLDGQTQAQFQENQKYIRFVDGNIVLGEVGNEILLKVKKDRISFLQNNVEVAYLSNSKLYVTDGEFLNSLQLGKFAFKPRSNGSLSFRKNK